MNFTSSARGGSGGKYLEGPGPLAAPGIEAPGSKHGLSNAK